MQSQTWTYHLCVHQPLWANFPNVLLWAWDDDYYPVHGYGLWSYAHCWITVHELIWRGHDKQDHKVTLLLSIYIWFIYVHVHVDRYSYMHYTSVKHACIRGPCMYEARLYCCHLLQIILHEQPFITKTVAVISNGYCPGPPPHGLHT